MFAIAEPQRSVLIAKMQRADQPATTVAVALPATTGAKIKKDGHRLALAQ